MYYTIQIKKSLLITVLSLIALYLIGLIVVDLMRPKIKTSDLIGQYKNNDITNAFMGVSEYGVAFFNFPLDSPAPLPAFNGAYNLQNFSSDDDEKYSFDYTKILSYKDKDYIVYMKFTKNNQAVKCTLTSKTAWEEKSGSTVFYK